MTANLPSIRHPNFVPKDHLITVLDWLLRLRQGKAYSDFHLFCLDFGSAQSWGDYYGAAESARLLESFGRRLATVLRSSDLVTRTQAAFWVITPPDDWNVIFERLAAVMEDFYQDANPLTKGSLSCYSPSQAIDESGASLLRLFEVQGPAALPVLSRREWQPYASA